MPLLPRGIWFARGVMVTVLCLTCGTLASAQRPAAKADQKPDNGINNRKAERGSPRCHKDSQRG
jgi:hypothetical protein